MTSLRDWPGPLRLAAVLFVLSLCGGWVVAMMNIRDKSTNSGDRPFSISGVVERYRGEDWTDDNAGAGAISCSHLVDLTHVHSFSMSILLFLLGALFCFSICPERAKRMILAASFTGLWVDMGSLWAIRYWPAPRLWAWSLVLSGIVMGASFAAMAFFALRDLLLRNPRPR